MAADEKDRLGEKLKKKQKAEEDLYFAEQDKQAVATLRSERTAGQRPAVGCPRCGKPLDEEDRSGVMIDVCPAGCGLWLDEGELETIAAREKNSWLTRLIKANR